MTETGNRAKLVAKEKRDGNTKKSLNVFGTFFQFSVLLRVLRQPETAAAAVWQGVPTVFLILSFCHLADKQGNFQN